MSRNELPPFERRGGMNLVMLGFELSGNIVAPRAKRQRRAEGGITIRC